jgi:YHS domain-containing protein
MARFILFTILFSILYYVLRFLVKNIFSLRKKPDRDIESEELIQDPYCQTYIPKQSAVKKKIDGQIFYFCNQECLRNYLNKMRKNS